MADISAVNKLFSTHLMPRKMPDSPVMQPRLSERARHQMRQLEVMLQSFQHPSAEAIATPRRLNGPLHNENAFHRPTGRSPL